MGEVAGEFAVGVGLGVERLAPSLEDAHGICSGSEAQRRIPLSKPVVEEIVTTRPERWARSTGRTARVTFMGQNMVASICTRKSSGVITAVLWTIRIAITRRGTTMTKRLA